MNTLIQTAKSSSLLLILFTSMLLFSACDSQPAPARSKSTPAPTASAPSAPGTPQLTQRYDFTVQDSGKTVTYTVTSRFEIIFNQQQNPKKDIQVSCNPAGTIGAISNLPYEAPPLYAVRYMGEQAGMCTIKNGSFLLTVRIVNLSSMRTSPAPSGGPTPSITLALSIGRG